DLAPDTAGGCADDCTRDDAGREDEADEATGDTELLGPLLAARVSSFLEGDLAFEVVDDDGGVDQLDRPLPVHRLEVLQREPGLGPGVEACNEHFQRALGHVKSPPSARTTLA